MADVPISAWQIPLLGHQFDLEDLPFWLSDQEITVSRTDAGYVLVLPVAIAGTDHSPIRSIAEEHLMLINGVGRLLRSDFQPVTLSDRIIGVDIEGRIRNTILAVGAAELRMKANVVGVLIGGKVQPDSRLAMGAPILSACAKSTRVHDAVTLAGRSNLTWAELYLLFELVEGDAGGLMKQKGWITYANADWFAHTSNSYSALRTTGRHGKDRGQPPKDPMPLSMARDLTRKLVVAWLKHVSS